MALLNIESTLRRVLNTLKKLETSQGVEVLSYKRNRGVSILKHGDDFYTVRERGYNNQEYEITGRELPRLIKSIMKREFPRSRKLRVYVISDPSEIDRPKKRL